MQAVCGQAREAVSIDDLFYPCSNGCGGLRCGDGKGCHASAHDRSGSEWPSAAAAESARATAGTTRRRSCLVILTCLKAVRNVRSLSFFFVLIPRFFQTVLCRTTADQLRTLWQSACNGSSTAQFDLGLAFQAGSSGLEKDFYESAVRFYGLATERGESLAADHDHMHDSICHTYTDSSAFA